jgi:predicted ATPase
MLKSLYIDNYKCFSAFDIKFESLRLLLGANGSGKSSLMDCLSRVQRLIGSRAALDTCFTWDSRTKWDGRLSQSVKLVVEISAREYEYDLVIEHNETKGRLCRIKHEGLSESGKPLFEFDMGEVQLFRDDFSAGPVYGSDWSYSALSTISGRPDNTKLSSFKDFMASMRFLRLNPDSIEEETDGEVEQLDSAGTRYPSWFSFLNDERPESIRELERHLREVLPGFRYFRLAKSGGSRKSLIAVFAAEDSGVEVAYALDELSTGQRALIILYTLLCASNRGSFTMIDEPENFIALPELQPWALEVLESAEGGKGQWLLLTHHPELLDLLADRHGIWLTRDANGPVRKADPPSINGSALRLSELVARGWA